MSRRRTALCTIIIQYTDVAHDTTAIALGVTEMRTLTEAETRRQTDDTDDGRSLSRRRQSVVERIQDPQYPRVLALEFIRRATLGAFERVPGSRRVLLGRLYPMKKA